MKGHGWKWWLGVMLLGWWGGGGWRTGNGPRRTEDWVRDAGREGCYSFKKRKSELVIIEG